MRTRLAVVVVVLLSMVSLAPLAMAAAPSEAAVPAGDVSMMVAGLCAAPEVTEVGEVADFDGEVIPVEPEPVCAAAACATTPAAVGDPLCAQGGTKCKNPGAECKVNNRCGICHEVITGDATGVRCRGCTCF